jgi:hypothetical protein
MKDAILLEVHGTDLGFIITEKYNSRVIKLSVELRARMQKGLFL